MQSQPASPKRWGIDRFSLGALGVREYRRRSRDHGAGMDARAAGPINRQQARKQNCSALPRFLIHATPHPSSCSPPFFTIRCATAIASAGAVKIRRCSLSNGRIPTPKWSVCGQFVALDSCFLPPDRGLVAVWCKEFRVCELGNGRSACVVWVVSDIPMIKLWNKYQY